MFLSLYVSLVNVTAISMGLPVKIKVIIILTQTDVAVQYSIKLLEY